MASTALGLHAPDEVKRRVMFALELVDPVTGRLASEDDDRHRARICARRSAAAVRSLRRGSTSIHPPNARCKIRATSKRRIFAPLEKDFEVPARGEGVTAADLIRRFALEPTGLYAPPAGMLAAAGMLIVAATDRTPLAGVAVTLQFRDAVRRERSGEQLRRENRRARSVRGGRARARRRPDDAAAAGRRGGLVGWLAFTNATPETRYTPLLPLRKGRMLRLPNPLAWGDLLNGAPQAPP